jgi:sarcosine oxidase
MPRHHQVIVLGLGAMGSAAIYQLAKRGIDVLGLDQFAPPHELGSSHGETRITRLACAEGAQYYPLAKRSHEIWRELERELVVELLHQNGMLMIAAPGDHSPAHGVSNFLRATVDVAKASGVSFELLSGSQVRQRFPAFRARNNDEAYYDQVSGFVRPERCIESQLIRARALGAALQVNETATRIEQTGQEVLVVTDKGEYRASQLIVAAGAYLPGLLRERGVKRNFTVTRQVLFWFKAGTKEHHRQFTPDKCPVFIWQLAGASIFYGFPSIGGLEDGVKVATECNTVTSASDVDRTVSPEEIRAMFNTYVAPTFPGLSRECVKAKVCLYTQVDGARFIIDRHPAHERIIIASPCSGHGFKHSAAIGELLARMAVGECSAPPEFCLGYGARED